MTQPRPNARPTALPDPIRHPEVYDGVAIKRALAWLVDLVVVIVLMVPAVLATAFIGLFFLPLLFAVVGFVYRVLTIAGASATWGMRLMAIEFRDARCERFDLGQALFHTAGYTVSVAVFPLQLISMGLMAFGPRGQGLTDLVLGSTAVNRMVV